MTLTVIQVIDDSPAGHTVRLSDGSVRVLERHPGESPTIGTEVEEVHPGLVRHVSAPQPASATVEQVNSDEQVVANVLSQSIQDSGAEPNQESAVSLPEQPDAPAPE